MLKNCALEQSHHLQTDSQQVLSRIRAKRWQNVRFCGGRAKPVKSRISLQSGAGTEVEKAPLGGGGGQQPGLTPPPLCDMASDALVRPRQVIQTNRNSISIDKETQNGHIQHTFMAQEEGSSSETSFLLHTQQTRKA